MLAAALFEWTFDSLPSLVLLIAPVAPLLPVAAVWSRRLDPAWELTATMPRTGLPLLMRRTLGVLSAVLPVLAVAGWFTGHSPGLWLLPALGFTAGTLALGTVVGVDRAALALTVAWSAGVVAPSLADRQLPAILTGNSLPGWALATVALTAVVLVRARRRPTRTAPEPSAPMTTSSQDRTEIMMRTVSVAETAPSTYAWAVHAEKLQVRAGRHLAVDGLDLSVGHRRARAARPQRRRQDHPDAGPGHRAASRPAGG